eukprot:262564-Rhodomonas_salina.2
MSSPRPSSHSSLQADTHPQHGADVITTNPSLLAARPPTPPLQHRHRHLKQYPNTNNLTGPERASELWGFRRTAQSSLL